MILLVLSLGVLLSAVLTIRGYYAGPRWQVYLFKPLTTALIAVLAISAAAPLSPWYQWAIVAGLIFSWFGDVFLMLPEDRFVPGLVSFLLAHLCYSAAWAAQTGFWAAWWALLPIGLYAALLLRVLLPHAGRLLVPVTIYALVIMTMLWQAVGFWQTGVAGAVQAVLGAGLFVISDSILAYNRFVKPVRLAQVLILGTYFAAQWLIAWSVYAEHA